MSHIAVVGTGTWATALAQVLVDNSHSVILIGRDKKQIDDININHQNLAYFPKEILLDSRIKATDNYEEGLRDASHILLAIPTKAIREVLNEISKHIRNKKYFINASKGFDTLSNKRISEVIRELIDEKYRHPIVSLIGPSHAEEVIVRQLTTVTSVSLDIDYAKNVQELFSNDYFRVYTVIDEVGAEYGVAIKNSIAIASGVLSGLGYGDNARAALVTRGLAEMVKFGTYFGGEMKTYLGLTGLGDLMVTCNSKHSRNFMAGYQIGCADGASDFLKNNDKTVEGIRTTKVIYEMSKEANIEMPIIEAIYRVLYEDSKPSELIKQLMLRPLKSEL